MEDNGTENRWQLRAIKTIKGREKSILALILFCVSSISCILLYIRDNRIFIYFGDAVSHIVRARQFIDSQHPGIINIGTVWLPLPHLLLIPFVAVDALFYSGTAGAVLGIPLLVGTGLLLFSIIESLTNSRTIAFLFALLFSLNPNVIYIALTPMSEMALLFFVTLSGYALLKWHRTKKEHWIALCSVAVMCATLCRYEAWLLPPIVSVVALHQAFQFWKRQKMYAAIRIMLIQKICWLGIIFWFLWNYFRYGDALKFAHWTYSVGTSAVRSTFHDRPQDVFLIIGNALLWIFGPMILCAGVLILFSTKNLSARKEQLLLLLFFSLPIFFTLSAILIGFVQIDKWWWNWRYVLPCGLFLSTASALVLQGLFLKIQSQIARALVVISFLVMPVMQISVPYIGVAIFNDASKSFDERSRSAAMLGEEMQRKYNGGSIALLTGYGVGQRIMISSCLPIKTFNILYFPTDTIFTISDHYVIFGKDRTPESEEFSNYWILNKENLLHSYNISLENNFFVMLEHK